jgi:hypothetical protein
MTTVSMVAGTVMPTLVPSPACRIDLKFESRLPNCRVSGLGLDGRTREIGIYDYRDDEYDPSNSIMLRRY